MCWRTAVRVTPRACISSLTVAPVLFRSKCLRSCLRRSPNTSDMTVSSRFARRSGDAQMRVSTSSFERCGTFDAFWHIKLTLLQRRPENEIPPNRGELGMNSHLSRSVAAALCVTAPGFAVADDAEAAAVPAKVAATQDALRDLWIGHVFWVRDVVKARLAGDGEQAKAAEQQVVANAQAIAGAIEPFYGAA